MLSAMAGDCSCLPVRVPVPPADCWWRSLSLLPPFPLLSCTISWVAAMQLYEELLLDCKRWKDPSQTCFLLPVSAFIHRLLDVRFVRLRRGPRARGGVINFSEWIMNDPCLNFHSTWNDTVQHGTQTCESNHALVTRNTYHLWWQV